MRCNSTDSAFMVLSDLRLYFPPFGIGRCGRSKWGVRWSKTEPLERLWATDGDLIVGFERKVCVLQCLCGTDDPGGQTESGWEDVGCPAWAKIIATARRDSKLERIRSDARADFVAAHEVVAVDCIQGILVHSLECEDQDLPMREPRFPLHPYIRNYALQLLQGGTPLVVAQAKCRNEGIRIYGDAVNDQTNRFQLEPDDVSSIYQAHADSLDIVRRGFLEDNLDERFGRRAPHSPFTAARLYYHPLTVDTDVEALKGRFALIVSTPSQQDAAWRYRHGKQVMVDEAYGRTPVRVRVFTLTTAVDGRFRAIPVAQ